MMDQPAEFPRVPFSTARESITLGASIGFLVGFVEGPLLLGMQALDWNQLGALRPVWYSILWVAPAFDAFVFSIIAFLCFGLGQVTNRFQSWSPVLRIMLFLGLSDLLLATSRLRTSAALIFALGLALVISRAIPHWIAQKAQWAARNLALQIVVLVFIFVVVEGVPRLIESSQIRNLSTSTPESPNVLLIVVDTLRVDHLASYGYPRPTSPTIDGLAQSGVQFLGAIATSSWTLPVHCSLLTGLLPSEHKALERPCDTPAVRLPEVLAKKGYRTAAFSGNERMFGHRQGFARGFHHFEDYTIGSTIAGTALWKILRRHVFPWLRLPQIPFRKSALEVTDSAVSWIQGSSGQPFFALLNYFDSHDPFVPPRTEWRLFNSKDRGTPRINTFWGEYFPNLTEEQVQQEIDAYDASIRHVDNAIHVLLDKLRRAGKLQNTLVILTSDHGESFGEEGLFHHGGALTLEQIAVPLIIAFPGHIPPGQKVSATISLADIPATIMHLLGHETSLPIPGTSIAHHWQGSEPSTESFAIAELAAQPHEAVRKSPNYTGAMKTIVRGEWQLVAHEKNGLSLYRRHPGYKRTQVSLQDPEAQAALASLLTLLESKTPPFPEGYSIK